MRVVAVVFTGGTISMRGVDGRLVDAARTSARGIVIAALGRGNVPPAMAAGIGRCVDVGLPVVIASRAPRGRVGQTYGYEGGGRHLARLGAIFTGSRRPTAGSYRSHARSGRRTRPQGTL
ncbi:MAG: hypothetical protein ACT4OZ_00575 [Gemmatimonadota bacterium]